MQLIQTQLEFQKMLAQERAIAFIGFEWSGQSKVSERLVEEWERDWLLKNRREISLYRICPDDTPFVSAWVGENAQNKNEGIDGGFGSVLWLHKGKAVQYVRYAAQAGAVRLSTLTREVFGN